MRSLRPAPGSLAACALSLALFAAPAAEATIVVPLTVEDMSVRSDVVVRGRVVNQQSSWDAKHERIYTFTELQVLDPIVGADKASNTVVVRTLGGEVGEVGMRVSGTAKFTLGEEVLVFLRVDPSDAAQFQIVGMSQGKYRIERAAKGRAVAVPSAEGLAFARSGDDGRMRVDPSTESPAAVALDELRKRIVDAANAPANPAPVIVAPDAPTGPAPR